MLVNSNKEGQDKKAAMLTNVGDIVEARYNEGKARIDFYSNHGYLGSTISKQKIVGYCLVMRVENLFRGYLFTFEYSPDLSKKDFEEDNKKNEEARQARIKERHEENKRLQLALAEGTGRVLHCWKCRATLTSLIHSVCLSCNGLICSCGACHMGCSQDYQKESLSKLTDSKKYQEENTSKITESKYQKCSVNGCIAQIPKNKVIEWNGRCPRHKHY